jgi:hypothetical protein
MTYGIQQLEIDHPESFGGNGGYGRAFGMLNCAFAFGGIVGPALSNFVVARAGWTALYLIMSAMNAVNVLLVVSFRSVMYFSADSLQLLFVGGLPSNTIVSDAESIDSCGEEE